MSKTKILQAFAQGASLSLYVKKGGLCKRLDYESANLDGKFNDLHIFAVPNSCGEIDYVQHKKVTNN